MNWSRGKRNRLAVAASATVLASAGIVFGVANSALPPESGPAVDTHVGHSNIYVVDVSSGQLTQPTNHLGEGAVEPSWSPDGSIAFTEMDCDECPATITQVDPADSIPVQIEATVKHVFQPSWAPDGRKLAVVGLGRGIYTVDVATHNSKRLTTGPGDEAPAWSPKGDSIAFHRQISGSNYDLFAVNPATGKQRRLTDDAKQQTNPAWSPDGSRVAFAEQQDNGRWAILTMKADGTDHKRVTDTATSAQEPSWSPDGTKIAFILQELDRATVATIDASGAGTPNRLTDESLFPAKPTWSADGTRIAFSATVVPQ
jgi:Tol biopolymer transport system component